MFLVLIHYVILMYIIKCARRYTFFSKRPIIFGHICILEDKLVIL